jgi:hypothetical protein
MRRLLHYFMEFLKSVIPVLLRPFKLTQFAFLFQRMKGKILQHFVLPFLPANDFVDFS